VNGNGGDGPLTTLARLRFQNPDRSCPSSNDANENGVLGNYDPVQRELAEIATSQAVRKMFA
jgi:hypothetical protein